MTDSPKSPAENLKKLRDEVRVQIHLGEKEVKEWWSQVEPKLVEIEETLAQGATDAVKSANVLIDEFADAFRRIRERLSDKE